MTVLHGNGKGKQGKKSFRISLLPTRQRQQIKIESCEEELRGER